MSEWWTYRLSDFLMFSPATYWRLVERYNREAWPLHLLMMATGLLLLWLAMTRGAALRRGVWVLLAAVWLWVGWAFHHRTYAQINWAADGLAIAFGVQALLLALAAARPLSGSSAASGWPKTLGLALASAGLLLYPLAGLAAGRPWSQAEVFGLMPEPTALVTLGLLLATGSPGRGGLAAIPVVSLLVGWVIAWLLST